MGQQRDNVFGSVEGSLNLRSPSRATSDALRIEPCVEAFLRKIGLQSLREDRPVLAGVGNEDTGLLERWHG